MTVRLIVAVAVLAFATCAVVLIPAGTLTKVILQSTAIVMIVVIYRKSDPVVARYVQGAQGEEKVAAVIDELAADGRLALHDVSFSRGNIDHILIGPAGLFTIETKSHRGNWKSDRIPRRMLGQAYSHRMRLEELTGLKAEPMLVFSHAYIDGQAVSWQRGVRVLPARMLAGHLRGRRGTIPVEKVRVLHARLVASIEQ